MNIKTPSLGCHTTPVLVTTAMSKSVLQGERWNIFLALGAPINIYQHELQFPKARTALIVRGHGDRAFRETSHWDDTARLRTLVLSS